MPTPRRRPLITLRRHPRLATTLPTEPGALPALARERFLPRPPENWRPWAWLAAFLLHVAAILVFLFLFRPRPPQEAFEPTGISVVYDSGQKTAAAPRPAPVPTPTQAPPPAAPPPPQAQADAEPEVNLNLPESPLATLSEPLPQPTPQSAPQPQHSAPRHARQPRRTPAHQPYMVMNNMSVGAPAPPTPFENKALNLNIGGAPDFMANSPDIQIEGQIGSDWQAGFNKWVNDHIYYPQAAAEQGQQGSATISFTVHRDGHVTDLHLLRSAGSPFLDQAWLGIFAQNNVPPFPPNTKNDTIKITATLNYELIR